MKQHWKKIAYSIVILSLLVSSIQGIFRIKLENKYKALQVAVRYTDVIAIAQQKDEPIQEVLQRLKDKGATTIFVRENTLLPNTSGDLSNWKAQGKLTVLEGYNIIQEHQGIENIEQIIYPELSYVLVKDDKLFQDIAKHLELKKLGGKKIYLDTASYIEYRGPVGAMSIIGMGYPLDDLQIAADMGYAISPQAKAWTVPSEGAITNFINDIERIPNLNVIYFSDSEVTGYNSNQLIELAGKNQIGLIEFFSNKQKGLYHLIKKASESGTNYKAVRLHTVTDTEANRLKPSEIVSRYWLAATERNQQVLLFKMPTTLNIDDDLENIEAQIEGFVQKATSGGYRISSMVDSYNLPKGNFIFAFLSGIGAIAIFVLLLDFIGQRKAGFILGLVGLLGYAGILKIRPTLGLQLMALFGASVYPAYAVLLGLQATTKNLKQTIILFLKTCAISFGGAITIVGLLSRTNFGLTVDLFLGVKLAHLIPIAIVIMGHIYSKYGISFDFIKKILTNKVTYFSLALMASLAGVLMIYTARTGNTGQVSSLELTFRRFLDQILGVRPRTKEFLIGYPLIITLYHYGYKERYLPILAVAIIGQISLVNTYAHVHTPLLISLIRSGYGIIFGLIIGIILIYTIKLIIKVAEGWKLKKE